MAPAARGRTTEAGCDLAPLARKSEAAPFAERRVRLDVGGRSTSPPGNAHRDSTAGGLYGSKPLTDRSGGAHARRTSAAGGVAASLLEKLGSAPKELTPRSAAGLTMKPASLTRQNKAVSVAEPGPAPSPRALEVGGAGSGLDATVAAAGALGALGSGLATGSAGPVPRSSMVGMKKAPRTRRW